MAYVLLFSIFDSYKANWSGCCILVCLRCRCPMLNICQNVEIRIVQGPFGVLTLCTRIIAVLTVLITRVIRKCWCSRLSVWRGSRLISRFFIVLIWINRLLLFLALGNSLGCCSATVFFGDPLCCCGSTVAELSSTSCEDECGGVRSRDLDLSSLLERRLCSADGGGSPDGDEGFISEKSLSDTSSGSGLIKGWVCGSCGTCAWGCLRSRDLDRSRCLSSCGWLIIVAVVRWNRN